MFYVSITLTLSSFKPFWFDEFFTFYLSQLDFFELIESIGPMDPHPPLNKLIVGLSQKIFGTTKFATRLPGMLYYVITSVLLYCICKNISDSKTAKISVVVLLISLAQNLSYEARPYSLVILLTTILLYLFLKTPFSRSRSYIWISLVTMLLLSAHFYTVFIPALIISSLILEYLFLKKTNIKLLISLIFGCTILIIYLPAIQRIRVLDNNNWAAPSFYNLFNAIRALYLPYLIILSPLFLNLKYIRKKLIYNYGQNKRFFIGIILLSFLVVFGFPISYILGAFHSRYFISSITPIIIIVSITIATFNRKQLIVSLLFTGVIFGLKTYKQFNEHIEKTIETKEILNLTSQIPKGELLLVSNPFIYFNLIFDQSPIFQQNIAYVINFDQYKTNKNVVAADISTYKISKLFNNLNVIDLKEIKNLNNTVYYLNCGTPFSYSMNNLQELKPFNKINKNGKFKLMRCK